MPNTPIRELLTPVHDDDQIDIDNLSHEELIHDKIYSARFEYDRVGILTVIVEFDFQPLKITSREQHHIFDVAEAHQPEDDPYDELLNAVPYFRPRIEVIAHVAIAWYVETFAPSFAEAVKQNEHLAAVITDQFYFERCLRHNVEVLLFAANINAHQAAVLMHPSVKALLQQDRCTLMQVLQLSPVELQVVHVYFPMLRAQQIMMCQCHGLLDNQRSVLVHPVTQNLVRANKIKFEDAKRLHIYFRRLMDFNSLYMRLFSLAEPEVLRRLEMLTEMDVDFLQHPCVIRGLQKGLYTLADVFQLTYTTRDHLKEDVVQRLLENRTLSLSELCFLTPEKITAWQAAKGFRLFDGDHTNQAINCMMAMASTPAATSSSIIPTPP